MAKPKLAVIGLRGYPAAFPGSSGIDAYLEQLLPHLKKNFDITLYTRSWAKSLLPPKTKFRTISIPTTSHFLWDTIFYSLIVTPIAILKGEQIFWFHAGSSCFWLPFVRLMGKKVIYTSHGIDWKRDKWNKPILKKSLKFLESISAKYSHLITSVSPKINRYYQKRYHLKSHLLPVGSSNHSKRHAIGKHLLYLGRLVPEKRVDWLIDAYNLLPQSVQKKYPLIICGHLDPTYHHTITLQNLAQHNTNIAFVGYVTGFVKDKLINEAKLLVLPSKIEGNSITLNEAINHHLNCLAADLPIHKKIKKKYPGLFLFKSDSFQDFCKKFISSINTDSQTHPDKSPYPPWSKTAKTFTRLVDNL